LPPNKRPNIEILDECPDVSRGETPGVEPFQEEKGQYDSDYGGDCFDEKFLHGGKGGFGECLSNLVMGWRELSTRLVCLQVFVHSVIVLHVLKEC
jgi:hypothetical protein